MLSRRGFMKVLAKSGMTMASAPLWLDNASANAMSALPSTYKAIVVVTLEGGNDGNNTLIPLDSTRYSQYAQLRPSIAIPQSSCIPLATGGNSVYGLHPSLRNLAALFNGGKALAVANVGPLRKPTTKTDLLNQPSLGPEALLSHPAGVAQWESASPLEHPMTGWGGRLADLLVGQSGSLPPLLDAGAPSIFTVGRAVQGIAVSGITRNAWSLPTGVDKAMMAMAELDSKSSNNIVAQAGLLRSLALQQQSLLVQAQTAATPLATAFPNTNFGRALQTIAAIINGRSVIGASRQIFYTQQGLYDTHGGQPGIQAGFLDELDGGIGAFVKALQEMGLADQVLLVTHSDFNRTMVANVSAGTDHAWGNNQFVIGGGIRGGRILGQYPDLDLGGGMDLNTFGTWIPTLSVTEMTAGIGAWMGLSAGQLASIFPDLNAFPAGPLLLV